MPPVVFDAQRLHAELSALTLWQRTVFAVTCVEVLIPSYVRFSTLEGVGDPERVRVTTDAVWEELGRSGVDPSTLPSPDSIEELLPEEDDWNEWAPQAEDAVAALVFLLGLVRGGDVDLAVYTAQRAYGAIDELVARQLDIRVLDAAGRDALLESPAIQAELQRQDDVLRSLRDSPDEGHAILSELRSAAQRQIIGGP